MFADCTGSVDHHGKIPLAEGHGWVGLKGQRPAVAAGGSIQQSHEVEFKQIRGFRKIKLLSHGRVKLTETAQGMPFKSVRLHEGRKAYI